MEESSSSAWRLQSDWYSPTRLHDRPVDYDFPGDRFIPNRSLMDLDKSRSILTNRTNESSENPKFSEEYRKKLKENLTLDVKGRPFRMLVFRGSPKSSRQSSCLIDEMRRTDEEIYNYHPEQPRLFPEKELRILDAPLLINDFYTNIMDWGITNILGVALGSKVHTLNVSNGCVSNLLNLESGSDYPTSLAWNEDAKMLAIGTQCSDLQLWDAEASKLVRILPGHKKRVGTVTWNGHILTSGSKDKSIINHDVRAGNSLTCSVKVHTSEVCGLKWSRTSNILASGGADNLVYIWHKSKMSSSHYMHCLNEHSAAVKALAWCPYNYDVLASGGGSDDGCLKLWNIQKGTCINSICTHAQICGLQWNRHHKEILSGHGYGIDSDSAEFQYRLRLWEYPSMSPIGKRMQHKSRVLHLSQSPNGTTLVSAGADETIRFWEIFGPPKAHKSRTSGLDSLLSFKTSPIR